MKADAVFYKVQDSGEHVGYWTGKTRRGALVKVVSTAATDHVIKSAWGQVVTKAEGRK